MTDLFQLDFCLDFDDRLRIQKRVKAMNQLPVCATCGSKISNLGFLRKTFDESLDSAKCLPCFLHNHTNVDQDQIDRITKIAEAHGWYKD